MEKGIFLIKKKMGLRKSGIEQNSQANAHDPTE